MPARPEGQSRPSRSLTPVEAKFGCDFFLYDFVSDRARAIAGSPSYCFCWSSEVIFIARVGSAYNSERAGHIRSLDIGPHLKRARADSIPPVRLYGIIICGDRVRLYTEFPWGHEHQYQGREVFSTHRDEVVFREFMDVVQALRYEDMGQGQVDRASQRSGGGELPPPEERATPANRGP
ncbi:hypothetical protein BO82DRAFT_364713 [Aspergillus uvarum CBS 121591]|uniref:Uncharacterized protein n=1 Tax=Aspergillus uvarum CBS 121591 TaxID=1448315 RepID=A0A319C8S2_9EURO|nr:hypothetical protein BO82DRAFT_364713 [Aspergillus uvarum CBS 121591]PYH81815.1 hypothetical protein BO82DRAFT_364713 [Aspergillus uvarum CBS 121591]